MTAQAKFEEVYSKLVEEHIGMTYPPEKLEALRDGESYGEGRHHLNGAWKGWQLASAQ